jgi:hypothetical protein
MMRPWLNGGLLRHGNKKKLVSGTDILKEVVSVHSLLSPSCDITVRIMIVSFFKQSCRYTAELK